MIEFKRRVERQNQLDEDEEYEQKMGRTLKRKPTNPQANRKDFKKENEEFGVGHEVELVLQKIAGQKNYTEDDFEIAKGKFDKELIKYSQDLGTTKKKKS